MNTPEINNYKVMAGEMFQNVGPAIGIHVFLLVLEQAQWQTQQKHEGAALIRFSETGISLDGLQQIPPEEAQLIAYDFIMAIINTLGRLVGKQLAHQLMSELQFQSKEE